MLIAIMVILILIQLIALLFVVWQFGVVALGLIQNRQQPGPSEPKNSFAILVCAHNEENAIPALLESLEALDYPKALYHTFVFADHCTDRTAEVAASFKGVTVLKRDEGPQNGKGDVLAWGLEKVFAEHPNAFDAFTIFDADNIADPAFLSHMNESLNKGEDVIQGNRLGGEPYRSIITQWYAIYWACYSVLFSYARQKLGLSCFLTGTGFTVRRDILQKYGWHTKSITEDVEFAIQHCLRNRRVAFNIDAVCYDEQPSNFFVMLKQICRWCTGSYQILGIYLGDLLQRFGKTRSVKLLDNIILLFLGPATVLVNVATILVNIMYISTFQHARLFQIIFIVLSLGVTFFMTRMTTKFANIPFKKLIPGFFLFPIFLFFYTICSLYSLFFPTRRWHKIEHQGISQGRGRRRRRGQKELTGESAEALLGEVPSDRTDAGEPEADAAELMPPVSFSLSKDERASSPEENPEADLPELPGSEGPAGAFGMPESGGPAEGFGQASSSYEPLRTDVGTMYAAPRTAETPAGSDGLRADAGTMNAAPQTAETPAGSDGPSEDPDTPPAS